MNTFLHYNTFGNPYELYVENVKRSGPFTMTDEHYHPYYEIYYLHTGNRLYFIHDQTYSVEQGDLVFINKHILHKTLQAASTSHERTVIHFNEAIADHLTKPLQELILLPFQRDGFVLRLPYQQQLAVDQLIRKMIIEIDLKEPGYELIPVLAVQELLVIVSRNLQDALLVPAQSESAIHGKIFEIVRHINGHFSETLRLNDLAKLYYISPHYLSRIFKAVTGFTFSDYVVLTRVKEAQRLLQETSYSISDIAMQVGFDNFSHFGKSFKRVTLLSPREYRKKCRNIVHH